MISKKKFVAAILAVSLVAALAVGTTVAYLTATVNPVTNTFTVGKIEIKLDEGTLAADGVTLDKDTRTTANTNNFKVVPGADQDKDPTVTVLKNSEACYVYACVENGLGTAATINIDSANWIEVVKSGDKALYRYKEVVPATTADTALAPVFSTITYATDLDGATYSALGGKTIIVNAFAHQSDSVTQAVADEAAQAQFGLS